MTLLWYGRGRNKGRTRYLSVAKHLALEPVRFLLFDPLHSRRLPFQVRFEKHHISISITYLACLTHLFMCIHAIPASLYVPSHSRSSLSNILEAISMSLSSTFPIRFRSKMTNSLLMISFESRRRFGIRLKKSECKMPRKVAYWRVQNWRRSFKELAHATLKLPLNLFADMWDMCRIQRSKHNSYLHPPIQAVEGIKKQFRNTSESSSPNCAVIFISFCFCFKTTG